MTKMVLVIQQRRSQIKSGSIVGGKIQSKLNSKQSRRVQPNDIIDLRESVFICLYLRF